LRSNVNFQQWAELKEISFLKERSGNLTENKGTLRMRSERSGNVHEKKDTCTPYPGMLLKRRQLAQTTRLAFSSTSALKKRRYNRPLPSLRTCKKARQARGQDSGDRQELQKKDVKIYGTNSVKSFRINKSAKKTNSNERENSRKNVLKMRKKGQIGVDKSSFAVAGLPPRRGAC
jgi:hypothetical protein